MPASEFSRWPTVLDALAAIGDNEVSHVVETECGFHIFKHNSPPHETVVSGSRLVISYSDAGYIRTGRRGSPIERSRADAFLLAHEIAARARQNPNLFPTLVDRYSEHEDAIYGGDMGAWSTTGIPDAFPREVGVLLQLEIGGVSDPLDSGFGVEILHRTPPRPRQHFAMDILLFRFNPEAPSESNNSRSAVREFASAILARVIADPEEFSNLQQKNCCPGTIHFIEGRDWREATPVLKTLRMREVSTSLVESYGRFMVLRRSDVQDPRRDEQVRLELNSPVKVDTAYWLAQFSPNSLRALFDKVESDLAGEGSIDQPLLADVRSAHQEMLSATRHGASIERGEEMRRRQEKLENALGTGIYWQYLSFVEKGLEPLIMSRR